MKTKILAVLVFGITIVVVIFYPGVDPIHAVTRSTDSSRKNGEANQSRIEAVFVLDTTGSMSGLIRAAKEKIWSLIGTGAMTM